MKSFQKYLYLLLSLSFLGTVNLSAQRNFQIQGTIFEDDSTTFIPFAYVINLRTGNGCMSDYNGRFTISGANEDTIVISYIGYLKKKMLIGLIANSNDSVKGPVKVILPKNMITLNTFTATAFKIKPYEREYMERIIHRPRALGVNALASPITALYEQYSRKGRESRKLAAIFEQIFIEEQIARKFNPEILRQLTGDDTIDFERFRKYCYTISNDFILTHDGYELYEPIMQCYRRWKKDGK